MSRLSALLLGTTIALVPPQIANALSAPEVAKVAEKVTVEDEKLGNSSSATIGQTVYIAGAPPSSQAIPVRTRLRLRVSPGKIIGIASQASEGYTLIKQSPSDKEEKEKTMEGWLWVAVELFVLCVVLTVGVFLRTTHKLNRRIMFLVAAQLSEHVPARYHKLRDLLSAGEWKKADLETRQVMLQVAGREKEGWQISALENFPCEDLRAIDKLWVKYSHGRFGFSVQKRIGLEEGGNICNWGRVLEVIGWLRDGDDGVLVTERDLTFDLGAPRGHLPFSVISFNWYFRCRLSRWFEERKRAGKGRSGLFEMIERGLASEDKKEKLRKRAELNERMVFEMERGLIEKKRRYEETLRERKGRIERELSMDVCGYDSYGYEQYGKMVDMTDQEFFEDDWEWRRLEGLEQDSQEVVGDLVLWVCLAHRCVNCSI